jgi:hypothetical protein
MRRWMTCCMLILLLGATAATAQSPFALVHLGPDVGTVDARIDGRGGWGVAETDTVLPNFANIASLPGLTKVGVVISGYGQLMTSTTDGSERELSQVRTPSVRVAVPFRKGRLVFTTGFRSLRSTQFDSRSDIDLELFDPDTGELLESWDGLRYRLREGTQFEIPFGAAYRLNSRVSIGASLNLAGGVVRERVTESFIGTDVDDAITPGLNSEVIEDAFDGLSSSFSITAAPLDRVRVGMTFTTAHDWSVTQTKEMLGLPGDAVMDYKVRIPAVWTAGAQVNISDRWRIGGEYESQQFSSLTGRVDWADISVDAWRMAFGIERIESSRRRGGMSNMPLRLGVSSRRLPYTMLGETIDERRIAIGTGVPFRNLSGHLDWALSYHWTGDEAKHGVEDHGWRLSVSLAGLEKWW